MGRYLPACAEHGRRGYLDEAIGMVVVVLAHLDRHIGADVEDLGTLRQLTQQRAYTNDDRRSINDMLAGEARLTCLPFHLPQPATLSNGNLSIG